MDRYGGFHGRIMLLDSCNNDVIMPDYSIWFINSINGDGIGHHGLGGDSGIEDCSGHALVAYLCSSPAIVHTYCTLYYRTATRLSSGPASTATSLLSIFCCLSALTWKPRIRYGEEFTARCWMYAKSLYPSHYTPGTLRKKDRTCYKEFSISFPYLAQITRVTRVAMILP